MFHGGFDCLTGSTGGTTLLVDARPDTPHSLIAVDVYDVVSTRRGVSGRVGTAAVAGAVQAAVRSGADSGLLREAGTSGDRRVLAFPSELGAQHPVPLVGR